jgi:hypothetical protein
MGNFAQPGQNSSRDPILKTPSQIRAGEVAQGIGLEFKPPVPPIPRPPKKNQAMELRRFNIPLNSLSLLQYY